MKYRYFIIPDDPYLRRWNKKHGVIELSGNKPNDWTDATCSSTELCSLYWYPKEISKGLAKLKFPAATI